MRYVKISGEDVLDIDHFDVSWRQDPDVPFTLIPLHLVISGLGSTDGIQKGLKLALTPPEAYLLGTALLGAANELPAFEGVDLDADE
jgi:hypothetical protein